MPYTLTKGLLWFLLALLIGIVIGWLLRSIRATSQMRAMRSARHDSAELERLRGRLANLEPAVAERDRLQAELAERNRATPTTAGSADPVPRAAVGPDAAPGETPASGGAASDKAEVGAVEVVEGADTAAVVAVASSSDDAAIAAPEPPADNGSTTPAHAPAPDLSVAAAVLGERIELDDLTAIEGIDPEIAVLCHGIGVTTWAELADTEVSLLRTMLADAGPRFADHLPDTWPQQARLLATGRWDEFRSLVSTLESGKLDE